MAEGQTALTFMIPDEDADDAILHISNYFGYQEIDSITGDPNATPRGSYAKTSIAAFLINIVEEGRRSTQIRDIVVTPIDIQPEP